MPIEKQFIFTNKGAGTYDNTNPFEEDDLQELVGSGGDGKSPKNDTASTTSVKLDNYEGTMYGFSSPFSATTYTVDGSPVVGGYARILINAPSLPTVTGGTEIQGSIFQPDTDMELIIESPDGTRIDYYFLVR